MAWDRQGLGLTPLLVPVPVPQPQEGPQWLYVWDFDGLLRESQREVLLLQRQMALRNQRETPSLPLSRPLALLSRPEQGRRLPGPGRGHAPGGCGQPTRDSRGARERAEGAAAGIGAQQEAKEMPEPGAGGPEKSRGDVRSWNCS
ncbi:peripheral-type benzodiazepine receptor-associated protein 1-like isoform X3 [Symphalangus syndactylus]|uniref:peripheral-type benzodiazepine receptor-associated protein 1-like isoform X3 n=1 Tax=Symphalangus syndactylus TaxID=9590 RepID=UPI0030061381